MTHVNFTKYICFLIKKPLHLFINQWESRTNALLRLLKPIMVSKIQRHDKNLSSILSFKGLKKAP